tara:strand:- start:1224 stop:1649 length:426 start_codon:yes stop_codon:yes gene_type:complete
MKKKSKKYKFLIVASRFYPKITKKLVEEAEHYLKKININYDLYLVNGSLEIPTLISIKLKKNKYDGVVALGCIIRGQTKHFDFIASAITNKLLDLSVNYDLPVTNAILTCETMKQAELRSSKKINRSKEAVSSALSILKNL